MIEVLKQSLEAVEDVGVLTDREWRAVHKNKANELRQAIAELESQEPYAWVAEDICKGQIIYGRPRKIWWECEKGVGKAFYTHPPQRTDYERGVIDGMQKQAQSSVDKAVNAMTQRTWVGLTDEETERLIHNFGSDPHTLLDEVDARLKARNI